uniref:Uncharacterized protein n=1 Tax=Timema monikensis TaxID=170555 RepID=A0A7R9EG94_9NEOP|nr:unnamed protein product [Timema monikensis]
MLLNNARRLQHASGRWSPSLGPALQRWRLLITGQLLSKPGPSGENQSQDSLQVVSQSSLKISDRMKPRLGDLEVTINFHKEETFTSLSRDSSTGVVERGGRLKVSARHSCTLQTSWGKHPGTSGLVCVRQAQQVFSHVADCAGIIGFKNYVNNCSLAVQALGTIPIMFPGSAGSRNYPNNVPLQCRL